MSIVPRQSRGGDVVGRLLRSAWRYKGLIAAAVLFGALLGYGWTARQPRLYAGAAWVATNECPPTGFCTVLHRRATPAQQLLTSPAVLARAVKLSGSRISAETLAQRLKVEVVPQTNLLTIRVVDSTATGAAQLANAVAAASRQILNGQSREAIGQLQLRFRQLETRSVKVNAQLARHPNDPRLRSQRKAVAHQLSVTREAITNGVPWLEPVSAAVPEPIPRSRGRPVAIGMLMGLLASAALAWWLGRPSGTLMVATGGI
jgi:LPS O-antigen subunit length determinant protein (WzzB/FepE family)